VRRQGDLAQIIDACARHGIRAIDPWRDQVAAIGLDRAVRAVRDAGLELSGYCRGGMFTSDAAHRIEVRDDNRRAVDEAKALGALGVALDVYHIWWDPELLPQIVRAGKDRLLAFHVCDWLVPTRDILNDRGMMGDGVIDIKSVRGGVEAQGFAGYSEIEIFSNDWWAKPIDEVLRTCIECHRSVV